MKSFLFLYGLEVFEYVIHLACLNHILKVYLKVLSELLRHQFHVLHLLKLELILRQVLVPTADYSKRLHLLVAVLQRPWLLKLLLQWGRLVLRVLLGRVLVIIGCLSWGKLQVGRDFRFDFAWDFVGVSPVLKESALVCQQFPLGSHQLVLLVLVERLKALPVREEVGW